MIKIGIIGFGGIARSHKRAHESLTSSGFDSRLVAICDINKEQFEKNITINLGATDKGDFEGINLYTDVNEMLEKENLDAVDICLPTYLHKEYAIMCLERGLHVFCEKPMALSEKDCKQMINAADKNGKILSVGMCLRFEPSYLKLKEIVDDGRYGKVINAHFNRLSNMPSGWNMWYHDKKLSGGVEFDMHIHDIDMIRFLFGEPKFVSAIKSGEKTVNTRLIYNDMCAVATGDWSQPDGFPFTADFRVVFEKATLLLDKHGVKVYTYTDEPFYETLIEQKRMIEEIRDFYLQITEEQKNTVNDIKSAMMDIRLAQKIQQSCKSNGKVIRF